MSSHYIKEVEENRVPFPLLGELTHKGKKLIRDAAILKVNELRTKMLTEYNDEDQAYINEMSKNIRECRWALLFKEVGFGDTEQEINTIK